MSRILGVIPARMGSSRFPGKPLADLHGKPLIQHVFERTAASGALHDVVIATCDAEIRDAARAFGARVVMTSAAHERATDRVAEVSAHDPADLVVMVQGDEPMIRPEMIAASVQPFSTDPSLACVNLAARIQSIGELQDANTVKVVTDCAGNALFFSRSPIPHPGRVAFDHGTWLKQVCIIAFRRDALSRFAALPQRPLEIAESVDMLRFLEHGIAIRTVLTDAATHAVDTPHDLALVARLMSAAGNATDRLRA